MAITRSQQAKQMLRKGGRIGFQGGGKDSSTIGTDNFKAREYSPSEEKDQRKTAELNQRIRESERGQTQTANQQAAINRAKAEAEAKEKRKNFIKNYIKDRQKLAYNASMLIPGQKKRSARYQKAYKDYLESMGVTPPDTLTGEEDDLADFFVNNAFDKPVAADANVQPPQSYGDFLLERFGAPGVKFSGNVGGKEVYVKGTRPDGSKIYDVREIRGGEGDNSILPIAQPVVNEPEEIAEYVNPLSLLTPRIAGTRFLGTEFAADGGRIGAMDGGIMSVENMDREAFLLGGIAKGLKKAVKGVKKLAKSPIGKAAIGAALFGGFGKGTLFGKGSFFGTGLNPLKDATKIGKMSSGLGKFLSKYGLTDFVTGDLTGLGKGVFGLGIPMALSAFTSKPEDNKFDLASYYAQNQLEPSQSIRGMGSEFDFYGGERMRVADGGDVEPVAKKTMPLLDMDGKEKDYRETGGFVDMGRMEKADDVPARLSKNEFVFTADAVRNAGEGDIDKGAEVMYNMMKNLESGGEVSEESQGLEGAREMFQTSQRLGEVI